MCHPCTSGKPDSLPSPVHFQALDVITWTWNLLRVISRLWLVWILPRVFKIWSTNACHLLKDLEPWHDLITRQDNPFFILNSLFVFVISQPRWASVPHILPAVPFAYSLCSFLCSPAAISYRRLKQLKCVLKWSPWNPLTLMVSTHIVDLSVNSHYLMLLNTTRWTWTQV